MHIRISLCIKFDFEQTSLNFWTKLAQEGYLCSITQKVNIIIEFCLLKLVLMPSFSSNWQIWFFGLNLHKIEFPVKDRQSEHHHGILHIWISPGTKLQLKLIILSFWTRFTQKKYLQLKTEQAIQAFAFCVVNVNFNRCF